MISLGEGNGTPLQYSCLENPMDGGAWWAAVHGITKSRTWLGDFTFTFHFHALEKEMATHSSFLSWRIPGKGEPGGLPSMGLQRVGHDWSDLEMISLEQFPCNHLSSKPTSNISNYYNTYARLRTKSLQSCLTLCNPMDCTPPRIMWVLRYQPKRFLKWQKARRKF